MKDLASTVSHHLFYFQLDSALIIQGHPVIPRVRVGDGAKSASACSRCASRDSLLSTTRLWKDFSRKSSHRIELWRIRRQKEELQIAGESELLIAMPAGSVDHHEDIFLAVAGSNFIHKNLPAIPIHTGQDQRIKGAVPW